jgi:predicted nucleic acid-binding protein
LNRLVLDSGALLASLDTHDRYHAPVKAALDAELERRVLMFLPVLVLCELDHFLRREGIRAALGPLLEDVASGRYRLESPTAADFRRARAMVEKHDVDLTDATVALVAERNGRRILTTDRRDFRRLRTATGKPFILLPEELA